MKYKGNKRCKCHSPKTEVMGKVGYENASPEERMRMVKEIAHEANAAQREVMGLEAPNTEASFEFDKELIRLIGITYTTMEERLDFYDKLKSYIESEKNKAREEVKNHLQNIINEFGGNAEQCLAILEEVLAGKTDVEL